MEKVKRNSNFELLRIISMLFIVIYHVRMHSGFSINSTGSVRVLITFINAIMVIHVNSFILITGYFQCKSKMRLSKVMAINNATWFYKVFFLIVFILLSSVFSITITNPINTLDKIKMLLQFDYGIYWYINCYLLLYLISPVLNKIINNLTKKEFQLLILGLFILISIIPTLTLDEVIYTRNGHSIETFILLYFIGAYLRIYPISENYFFKVFSNTGRRTVFIFIFFFCAVLSLFCNIVSRNIGTFGTLAQYLSQILNTFYTNFGSPIIIIQAVAYFLFFSTLSFDSKIINFISKYTLGIYLIHENIYVRENLYRWIGFKGIKDISLKVVIMMFIVGVIIFIIGFILEFIRQALFKFIYNRKLSAKIRKSYRSYFKNLGLNINW